MSILETLQAALSDRYRFEREIGAGGMATVYLARDLRHDRQVAVKVLKPELGAVLGADRFLSEIKVTANLQHPNLLPLFDSGEASGLLFYVMPFVEGETLRERLDREKQLPIEEAVHVAVAAASALEYAHSHGVIHRDLKPENIFIHSGQPIIADFGIALAVSKAGGARVTQTGLSLGTPQYMSPEQAAGDRVIDARSDIYSLGAVTYEMLGGEPPHSGSSAQAIIAKLMTSEPRPLTNLRGTVPIHVAAAVEKSLAKLPADRFASAKDFGQAIRNPSFTIPSLAGRSGPGRRKADVVRERLIVPLGALAIIGAGAAVWAMMHRAPPRATIRYEMALDSTEALGGSLARIALSPDGSLLAYTSLPGPRLILRERNQLRGSVIPGTIGDQVYSPFFSPDGTKVGYVGPPSFLKVVSLAGGPPVLISDSLAPPAGCFGPDGFIYATGLATHGIVRMADSPGAVLKKITRVDSAHFEESHVLPEVLPNNKGVLFTIRYFLKASRSPAIAVADLSTGKYRVLVSGDRARYSPSGHLLYVTSGGTLMMAPFDENTMTLTGQPVAITDGIRLGGYDASDFQVANDGTLVYLAGGTGADRELVWVARDGKTSQVDPTWKGAFSSPVLSPDGTRVAVQVLDGTRQDIWVKQLDRGPRLKLTFTGNTNVYPAWTADGASVTYRSDVSGSEDFWTKRADGSAQPVLQLHQTRDLGEGIWSRDGKWFVYRTSVNVPGAGDIFAIRPGVDSAPIPLVSAEFSEQHPSLSPDGRFLAYTSNETGRNEVYVVPFPNSGSAKWPVSTQGASVPRWSHSGRELFYLDAADNLVSVSVSTNPTFSATSTTVLFSAKEFLANVNHPQYDVSRDDKRFLMVRALGGQSPDKLVFVENWFGELKSGSRQ